MKRKIGITCIFISGIIASLAIFSLLYKKKYDVIVPTFDGAYVLELSGISTTKPKSSLTYSNRVSFTVENMQSFIMDLQKQGKLLRTMSEGRYLLLDNQHYFYFEQNENIVTLYQMYNAFYGHQYSYAFLAPTIELGLVFDENNFLSWKELIGCESFDDVISFYEQIDSEYVKIDYIDKKIMLRPFSPAVIFESKVKFEAISFEPYSVSVSEWNGGIIITLDTTVIDDKPNRYDGE